MITKNDIYNDRNKQGLKMKKILVVDDVRENLIAIKETLEDLMPDCLVLTAQSGKEGLKTAKAKQPDTILTDINMPVMDGFEVCKKLNEDETTKHIPIMIFTGSKTDSESRIKCLEAGADVFLTKPIDTGELTAQINVLFRIKEAEDKLRAERELLDEKVKERTKELQKANKSLKQDITERKQTEKALQESEQLNRTVIDNSPIGISVRDKNGTLLLSNKAWQKLWGLSNKEISDYHKPRKKLVFNDKDSYLSNHLDKINNVYKTGGEYYIKELKLPYTKKNTADWISQYFYAIKDDKGNVQRVVVLTKDITNRKKAEEELRIGRERLKTANSILRHDIANDVIVIKSALDIYRDEQDETMLDEIEKRVEKSLNTIKKQRDREQFIDSHTYLDEYEIEQVVHDIIKNYPDIKINVTGTGKAYADNAIYSVFENIISNAIKHGKTTKLDIGIGYNEDYCEIRFTDYGIGIPDEFKYKIFEEGFQYGETGHTGIGLYIVQQTIEDYDGIVFVEDNKPNGVVFVIRLRKIIER